MLTYSVIPDHARTARAQTWWNEVGDDIERASPSLFRQAAIAKANLNKDTGGGFLQFCWESITGSDLESFYRSLEDASDRHNF